MISSVAGQVFFLFFFSFCFQLFFCLYFGPFLDFSPLNLMMCSSPTRSRKKSMSCHQNRKVKLSKRYLSNYVRLRGLNNWF
jgi:hypothetical protein